MADKPKKVIYLAVRRPSPKDGDVDPFNGYLTDKQYLDKQAGVYLNNEDK